MPSLFILKGDAVNWFKTSATLTSLARRYALKILVNVDLSIQSLMWNTSFRTERNSESYLKSEFNFKTRKNFSLPNVSK